MEYAVLGGGALGLMAAYRLAQAGQSVIDFEQEKIAGGLASGFQVGDTWLEKFYHHIFQSDKKIIQMIEELGLEDRLEWLRPRTVSLIGGEIHQLDSPLTLLTFNSRFQMFSASCLRMRRPSRVALRSSRRASFK